MQAEVEGGGWRAFLERAGCAEATRSSILADPNAWIARCAARTMACGPKYGGRPTHKRRRMGRRGVRRGMGLGP